MILHNSPFSSPDKQCHSSSTDCKQRPGARFRYRNERSCRVIKCPAGGKVVDLRELPVSCSFNQLVSHGRVKRVAAKQTHVERSIQGCEAGDLQLIVLT